MIPQIISFLRISKSHILRQNKRQRLIHYLFLISLHCLIKILKRNKKVWIVKNNCNIITKEYIFDHSPPLPLGKYCPCGWRRRKMFLFSKGKSPKRQIFFAQVRVILGSKKDRIYR